MTVSPNQVSCVIPAFNEGEGICDVINRIKAISPDFEVIVADDGSTDDTAEQAEKAGARVVRHPYNIGNGAAVKSGIRASEREIIVMLDADGQHPPEEIPKLLEHIGPYDMTVGARSKKAHVSRFRSFGNWGLISIAEFLTGHKIPDLTSGFRAIKREKLMRYIHLFPNQYSYPTTITMSMLKSGDFVKFVMLDSIIRRQGGQSGIRPFRDGVKFINIMIRIIMLFDPQKVFTPIGLGLMSFGITFSVYHIVDSNKITSSAVLTMLAGLFVLLIGLLADQIAATRRELFK